MKKKMFNRGISILLVVVMLLSMSGVTAFGETEDETFNLEDIKVVHQMAMSAFSVRLYGAENTIDLRGMFSLPGSDSLGRVNYSEIDKDNYNQLNLTEDNYDQISSAWYEYRVNLEENFAISSQVWLGDKSQYDKGGSGITFTLQNSAGRKDSLGSMSGGIGVGSEGQGNDTIENGIAIEIDTFLNEFKNDANYNNQTNRYGQDTDIVRDYPAVTKDNHLFHLAVQETPLGGVRSFNSGNFIGEHINPKVVSTNDVNENQVFGQWLDFEVTWTKQSSDMYLLFGTLTAGGQEYSTFQMFTGSDLVRIFGNAQYVYWGFTSATGNTFDSMESNEQRVSFDSLPIAAEASIKKEVRNVTDNGAYGQSADADIEDTIEYKVTVSLDDDTPIPLALLNFSDAIDENLDVDMSSLKVEKRGVTYTVENGDIQSGSEQGEQEYYEDIMKAKIENADPDIDVLDPEPTIYYYIQEGVLHIYGLGTMGKYQDDANNAGVVDYIYDAGNSVAVNLSAEDVVITFEAEVTGANDEGQILNTAVVSSGSLDNSITSEPTTITVNPSLQLVKYVDKEEANEGSTLEYIVHISNPGGSWYGDITDPQITNAFSNPSSTLITPQGGDWVEVYKRISWESEELGNGQDPGGNPPKDKWEIVDEEWQLDDGLTELFKKEQRLPTTIETGDEYYIKFLVTVNDGAYLQTIYNTANYTGRLTSTGYSGESNQVSTRITGDIGEIEVEKSVSDSSNNKLNDGAYVDVGDVLTYSITVKNVNARPSTVVNLKITDIIPKGLTYKPSSLSYDTAKYSGRFYEENGENIIEVKAKDGVVLESSQTVTITYDVTVTGYGELTNVVTATSDDDEDDDTSTVVSAHTVTYDANGGSRPNDMLIYEDKGIEDKSSYTIKDVGNAAGEIPFAYPGHEFLGWNKNKDALEADDYYEPGTSVIMEQNLYLYAIWEKTTGPQLEIKKIAETAIEVTTEEKVKIKYKIEVKNIGEVDFEGYIEDELPEDISDLTGKIRVSITDENNTTPLGDYTPENGILKIDLNLQEGKKVTIEFELEVKVAAQFPQMIMNVAIAKDKEGNELDDSTVTTTIRKKEVEPDPGIKLIKAVSKSVVKSGSELTYVLTLDNPSTDTTWTGSIEDLLPAGVQPVSEVNNVYNVIASSDSVKYDIPVSAPNGVRTEITVGNIELPPQEWLSISVNVEVTAAKGTRLENYAEGIGTASSDDLTSNKVYTYVSDDEVIIDLAYIVKNADPTSIIVSGGTADGETIKYSIDVINPNPTSWVGYVIDSLPAGMNAPQTYTLYRDGSNTGTSHDMVNSNGTFRFAIDGLESNHYVTIEFTVTLTNNVPDRAVNVVQLFDNANAEIDRDSVLTVISGRGGGGTPKIEIAKTVDKRTAEVGDILKYEITGRNTSNTTWQGTITDTLPDYVDLKSQTIKIEVSGTYTFNHGNGLIVVEDIALDPGETIKISFEVEVLSEAAGKTVRNTAVAGSTNNGTGGSDYAETDIDSDGPGPGKPDVTVTKLALPEVAISDGEIKYQLLIQNNGSDVWNGKIEDTFDSRLNVKSIEIDGQSIPANEISNYVNGNIITISNVTISPDSKMDVIIVLEIPGNLTPTTVINRVEVIPDGGTEPDDDDEISTELVDDGPGDLTLVLRKRVWPITSVNTGAELTYTITAANMGTEDWTGIITDAIPIGTTYKAVDGITIDDPYLVGIYDDTDKKITVAANASGNSFTLEPGDTVTITFIVTVNADAAGTTIENIAYGEPEDTSKDVVESDKVETDVRPGSTPGPGTPDISVKKTGPGDIKNTVREIPYQLFIENSGDGDWNGKIVDTFASGLTVKSVEENGGTLSYTLSSANVITINNFMVPAKSSRTVNIILEIPSGFQASQIVNKVEVIPDGKNDPDDEDETTTVITDDGPGKITLTLDKRNSPTGNVNTGSRITYTIRVSNLNEDKSDWTGIVTDTIPVGTTFTAGDNNLRIESDQGLAAYYDSSSNRIVVARDTAGSSFTLKYNETFDLIFVVTVNSGTEESTITNIAYGTADNGVDNTRSRPVTNYVNKSGGGGGGGGGGGTGGGDRSPSVIYHVNNGSGERNVTETYREGATVTVKGISIFKTPEGYTFEGWAESASGNVVYDPGDTFKMPSSNVNLYAVWTSLLNYDDHYAYIVGYEDGLVKPNNNVSREEVASIFFRLLTDEARNSYRRTTNRFPDVEADRWSTISISTLTNMGILTGYEDGTFDPGGPITRAELAVVAANFDTSEYTGSTTRFNDLTDHWATNFIGRASARGWVSGYPDGSFKPDNYITRAELVTLVNNVLHRHPRNSSSLLSNMVTFPDNSNTSEWYYLAIQEASNSHYYDYDSDSDTEVWTELRTNRDWAQIERL